MGFLMLVDNLRIKFHWGVYQVHLGGISGTLGGYIRYTWGVYQVQALSLEAAENKEKSGVFLALNLFKTI
jgi:hypothetical protein